jgi:hypothetical protein
MDEPESQSPEREDAHDVLAAEAFAVPAADPDLRHHRVVLPDDPSGIPEPHDILAAEEFPLPSARAYSPPGRNRRSIASRTAGLAMAGGLLTWLIVRRRSA